MFRIFGENEFAARLPFALTAIVFMGIFAASTRRLFSEVVSAVAVFTFAFAPFAIEIARECRFYTIHQLLYFCGSLAIFSGFENRSAVINSAGALRPVDWRWLVAGPPCLLAAFHFQPLTINFGLVAGLYVLVMFVALIVRHGWKTALTSKYSLVLFLGIAALVVVALLHPEEIRGKIREATKIEEWQLSKGYDGAFYRYFLVDHFPAIAFLYPVGAYVALRRYGRTGLFLFLSAAPLLLVHSYVFARKSERYIFYFFPFFLITAAVAIEPMLRWGWDRLRDSLRTEKLRSKLLAAAFLLPGALVIVHPWFGKSFAVPFRSKHPDWKSLDHLFKNNLRSEQVITTNPQAFLYYVGKKPDYYLLAEIRRKHEYEPTLVRSEEQFSNILRTRHNLYFIGAEWNFYNEGFMSEPMRNAVEFQMYPIDHGGDRRILTYHK
jgi:hypothetical protein